MPGITKERGSNVKEKILLIRESDNNVICDLAKKLGEDYEIIKAEIKKSVCEKIIKEEKLKFVIFIFSEEVTPMQLVLAADLSEKAKEQGILTVTIASADVNERVHARSTTSFSLELERPISMGRIIDELNHLGGITMESSMKHLLVVDDDGLTLRSIYNLLKDMYQVQLTNSGKQIVEMVKQRHPDLILLDYEMPEFDGKQTLEALRADSEVGNTPVMFLTGVAQAEKIKEILLLKPQGYLLKASGKQALIEALDGFFAK